ncbi:hypothetical protein MIMGU_mgv1a016501mg [Erythranthe guttata]|uniref:Uncharacterized protein n=1 Tax=Erythranthe guttata TaxID=4155 RepID=A0A022RTC5_ERYGU|nr:hypothetical protein MIMGU_mgv1a016501mg [Erythranthe guttata]
MNVVQITHYLGTDRPSNDGLDDRHQVLQVHSLSLHKVLTLHNQHLMNTMLDIEIFSAEQIKDNESLVLPNDFLHHRSRTRRYDTSLFASASTNDGEISHETSSRSNQSLSFWTALCVLF